MKPTIDNYPVFEANQVLSNVHLNNVFDYLDEQQRLTRANLIGIGIVCGLEIQFNDNSIKLSKGCGITSEGYLIVEPEDIDLIAYRKLDQKPSYDPFAEIRGDLYELLPRQESGANSVSDDNFFQDKAVLLFLELKSDNLRNCSPNNCNDQGTAVTPTVRRLLLSKDDLEKVIKNVNALETSLTSKDLERDLLARLNLPDLRLLRYNLPRTETVTSEAVLTAFLHALQDKFIEETGNALRATYDAFKPLLQGAYEQNPFAGSSSKFTDKFGFLETGFASIEPEQVEKVKFLQYYYDFFDDLLRAYDEFRWKGMELMCSCCPHGGLFPRHLMLGVLFPDTVDHPSIYRQRFLPSSAVEGCKDRSQELVQLFQRMVEMVDQFSDTPLEQVNISDVNLPDEQIRVTPSKLGDVPLSEKAIPYYYLKDNKPQLFEYWNVEKTRRHRSKQNLSYHAQNYANEKDRFVTEPLHYDLENYNFLRIEGHLGKDYRPVMNTLLSLKERIQLPVEIIALCTGAFDEKIEPNISAEDCRFQDLESLYDVLKEKLICFLCKEVQFFYDFPVTTSDDGFRKNAYMQVSSELQDGELTESVLPLLKHCAPEFKVKPGLVSQSFETWLARVFESEIKNSGQSFEVWFSDQSQEIFSKGELRDQLFSALNAVLQPYRAIYKIIIRISMFFNQVSEDLKGLVFKDFDEHYRNLVNLIERNELFKADGDSSVDRYTNYQDWEGSAGHLEAIRSNCLLAAFKGLYDEYLIRKKNIKKKLFLKDFLDDHPGIQHKAGVPLGGTFIVVYHHKSDSEETNSLFKPGDVIADFYLPYLCCSDCSPIQYVLPKISPIVSVQVDCALHDTQHDMPPNQKVTIKIRGGISPYYYKLCKFVDGECKLDEVQCFKPLGDHHELSLGVGEYTIVARDSMGAESVPQCFSMPIPLTISDETVFDSNWKERTYRVKLKISGGAPLYKADLPGRIDECGNEKEREFIFTSNPITSKKPFVVTITDDKGCTVTSREFRHTVCPLPCDGNVVRCGYLFWVPQPTVDCPLESYCVEIETFNLTIDGCRVELEDKLSHCIRKEKIEELNTDFRQEVNKWLCAINKVVAKSIDGVNVSLGTRLKRCAIRCFNQIISVILRKEDYGTSWIRLGYRGASTNKREALTIEHFDCKEFIDFKIIIKATYCFHHGAQQTRTITYTRAGTSIDVEANTCEIMPFDCESANKCNSDYWRSTSESPVIKSIVIDRGIVDCNEITCIAHGEGIVQYLWECEDGSLSVMVGNHAKTELTHLLHPTKRVRFTAISETGGTSTKVTTVKAY